MLEVQSRITSKYLDVLISKMISWRAASHINKLFLNVIFQNNDHVFPCSGFSAIELTSLDHLL